MARNRINLPELPIYRDIYGLDLSTAEIDELKKLHDDYSDFPGHLLYKNSTNQGFTLRLHFLIPYNKTNPEVDINVTSAVDTATAPTFYLGGRNNICLTFYPKPEDKPYILALNNFLDVGTVHKLVFNSMDEIKHYILSMDIPKDEYDEIHPDFIHLFYWAAGKLKEFKPSEFNAVISATRDMPEHVTYIGKVLEHNNTRYAFCFNLERGHWPERTFITVFTTKVSDPHYNYTDAKRYFSGPVFFEDENPIIPADTTILENYARGQDFVVLDNPTVDVIIRRHARRLTEQQRQKDATKILETRMGARIDDLADGKSFTFNELEFFADKIVYEGQELASKAITTITTKSILESFHGNYSDTNLNFDRILDTFVEAVYEDGAKNKTVGNIGSIAYELESKKSKSGSTLFYINTYRINRDEITDVLKRALCYTAQEDYHEFLDSVSNCSLKMHKYLATGIDIFAKDEILDTSIVLKLPLSRKKNVNYISLGGKAFKISDTARLLQITGYGITMAKIINTLIHKDIVGITGTEIKFLIEEGKKAYTEIKEKYRLLTESTFKKFNVTEGAYQFQNGQTTIGYCVAGKKREYIIDKASMKVYENPTGRYICMIDKVGNESNSTAKLINRVYALANDAMLATEIHTLNT